MRLQLSVFVCAFFLTFNAKADLDSQLQKARDLKLAEQEPWLRLIHFQPTFFRGFVSLSRGKAFFLSDKGATDPRQELEATLQGFYSAQKRPLSTREPISLSVMCQFPARFEFLNRELDLSKENFPIRPEDCSDYQNFRKRLNLESVSLVFSSHYVGNPSSIYGHTFLRLEKKKISNDEERNQLLDNGVNFSADPTTTNPLLYAVRGLTGGFDGRFAVLPFYYKVREYSDYESRDLWDYKLALSSEELDRFQAHLWELGTTHFDYYYLTENCSYYVLALLEAAAPRLQLLSQLPFWVLPSDTVKAVANVGLVHDIRFRPSLHTQFEARKEKLDSTQLKVLRTVINAPETEALKTNDVDVLDAALDLYDLQHLDELLNHKPESLQQKRALLIARSKLPVAEPLGSLQGEKVSPHLSHPSARLGVGRIEDKEYGGADEIQFRFAYHDLLDPPTGLPATSEIQFFDFKFRYWERSRVLRIENATLFGVTQLSPVRDFFNTPSWKLKLLARRFDDPRCENCTGLSFESGYGLTLGFGRSNLTYALAEGEVETASKFEGSKFQPRLGGLLGTRLRLANNLGTQIEIKALRNFFSESFTEKSLSARVRWAPLEWRMGLEFAGLWTSERQEIQGSLFLYF